MKRESWRRDTRVNDNDEGVEEKLTNSCSTKQFSFLLESSNDDTIQRSETRRAEEPERISSDIYNLVSDMLSHCWCFNNPPHSTPLCCWLLMLPFMSTIHVWHVACENRIFFPSCCSLTLMLALSTHSTHINFHYGRKKFVQQEHRAKSKAKKKYIVANMWSFRMNVREASYWWNVESQIKHRHEYPQCVLYWGIEMMRWDLFFEITQQSNERVGDMGLDL